MNSVTPYWSFRLETEVGMSGVKLQALPYNILPPTTALVDYAVGLEKLSANEQFFDDAQMAVSFVTDNSEYIRHLTDHVAYTSSD